MNYQKNLMTGLGVSVVVAASVTLDVGYAWQICLLYHLGKNDFKSGVELVNTNTNSNTEHLSINHTLFVMSHKTTPT